MLVRMKIRSVGRIVGASAVASILLAGITANALAVHPHPLHASATLAGTIRGCGGPPPGRCEPLTAHISATSTKDHGSAGVSGTAHGKFSYRVPAARYTIVARCNGVNENRHVFARGHQTTRVRFTFHIH